MENERGKGTWRRGFWMILLSSIINGLVPSISQKGFSLGLSVETVLFGRFFIGVCALWIYILVAKRPAGVGKPQILFLLGIGLSSFLATAAMNEGYRHMPGAVATVLVYFYVVIVTGFEIMHGKERLWSIRSLCLCFAILGLMIVIMPVGALKPLGIFFCLLASVFYALQVIGMGSRALKDTPAEVITGYMMVIPMVVNFMRCMRAGEPLFPQEAGQWLCILILGLGAAFAAPVLYCASVKLMGGGDTALVNTFEPVVAYIAGILIMSQHLSMKTIFGGCVVLFSVFLLNLSKARGQSGEQNS